MKSKILGVDTGSKRIGVAISDALGITAQPLTCIVTEDRDRGVKELKELARREDVKEIIIGLPLNMNGSKGDAANIAIEFCKLLSSGFDIPVKLWDERMTTLQAERIMITADVSRKKRKKKIDTLSAQLILQSYLNSLEKHA